MYRETQLFLVGKVIFTLFYGAFTNSFGYSKHDISQDLR